MSGLAVVQKWNNSFCFGIILGALMCYFIYSIALEDVTNVTRVQQTHDTTTSSTTSVAPATCATVKKVNKRTSFEHAMSLLHKERITTLTSSCRAQGMPIYPDAINKNLLCSKKYKIAVCDIQKCGSTSWLGSVMVMEDFFKPPDYFEGRIRGREVMELANNKLRFGVLYSNKSSWTEEWQNSLKIITVRNPFARIVSAYNDKMALNSPGATEYYKPISQRISAQYRGMRRNVTERLNLNGGMATFEDFVNFLINLKDAPDSHWVSYESNCLPCMYKYDMVIKLETLHSDVRYLEQLKNITEKDRKVFFINRDSRSKEELVEKMFKNVPRKAAVSLYLKYKKDFDRFGYSKPNWLK